MKKDREELENKLIYHIGEIKDSRKLSHEVTEYLSELNVPVGTFERIISEDLKISETEIPLLYALTTSVYKVSKAVEIEPSFYFTEREIRDSENILKTSKQNEGISLPIEIEDVTMLHLDSYVTKIQISELVNWLRARLIIYEYESQRGATYKSSRNGVVKSPMVNLKSVEEIAKDMLNGSYLEDTMTLNIYSDEVDAISYNEKTRKIIINEGAVISILDGFHRLKGGDAATIINPELDQLMILSIRSYDSETAQKYFGQINTINIVKKERIKELRSEKYSDLVVRGLQKKSELKGKIASASKTNMLAEHLTTFDILSYGVDRVFTPTKKLDVIEIEDYLSKFFDYLVGNYVDEFQLNVNKYRETNINHALVFLGYIVLAKHMQDNEAPLKEIKKYVKLINFKDQELVDILHSKAGINSAKTRKMTIDYFKNLFNEVKVSE